LTEVLERQALDLDTQVFGDGLAARLSMSSATISNGRLARATPTRRRTQSVSPWVTVLPSHRLDHCQHFDPRVERSEIHGSTPALFRGSTHPTVRGAITTPRSLDGVADAFGHALRRSRRMPQLQHDEKREHALSDKNSPGADRGQVDGEGEDAQAQDPSADDGFLHEFGLHVFSVVRRERRGCSTMHRPLGVVCSSGACT